MIYAVLAALIFGLDIFIKNRIDAKDDADFPITLKSGIVLEKHHNHGFIMNRLESYPNIVRIFSLLTMVPLLFYFFWLLIRKATDRPRMGAAFLVGGAASNVYDRFFRGYVVDYLRLPIKKIRHIIFNIADFFIFLGAALTALSSFFKK